MNTSVWPVVRLGDVAKPASGGTPKRGVTAFYGGTIPWVKSGELGDSTVYETQESITEAGLKGSSAKVFPKGTLCVALYGATVGKLGILGVDAATNQAVCGIFLPKELDTRFAYRFLESKRHELIEMGKGGAQPNHLELFQEGGVAALLHRQREGGRQARMSLEVQEELVEKLRTGEFRRARDVLKWLKGRMENPPALKTLYYWFGKVGGVLKMPRKTHTQKDPAKVETFRWEATDRLAALVEDPARPVRLWVADEHRYGLLPVIRRCWSLKGVRVVAPYATKYQWGYLYEAMEVDGENRIELFFAPRVGKDVSNVFLEQIAQSDLAALHLVVWDQAGFHPRDGEAGVPENVRLLPLPPYSPELNPVEQLGDLVKDAICNKLYPTLDKLEEAILTELEPLRHSGEIIAGMLGTHAIVASANGCAKF